MERGDASEANQVITETDLTTSLQSLYLQECKKYSCRVNTGVVKLLPSTIEGADDLKKIDLSKNIVGSNGVKPVFTVASRAQYLEELILVDNYLTNENVKEMTEKLSGHSHLKKIDLSRNPISHAGGKTLNQFARKNPQLEQVQLDGTLINVALVKIIQTKCKEHEEDRVAREEGREPPVREASPAASPMKSDAVVAAAVEVPAPTATEPGAAQQQTSDAGKAKEEVETEGKNNSAQLSPSTFSNLDFLIEAQKKSSDSSWQKYSSLSALLRATSLAMEQQRDKEARDEGKKIESEPETTRAVEEVPLEQPASAVQMKTLPFLRQALESGKMQGKYPFAALLVGLDDVQERRTPSPAMRSAPFKMEEQGGDESTAEPQHAHEVSDPHKEEKSQEKEGLPSPPQEESPSTQPPQEEPRGQACEQQQQVSTEDQLRTEKEKPLQILPLCDLVEWKQPMTALSHLLKSANIESKALRTGEEGSKEREVGEVAAASPVGEKSPEKVQEENDEKIRTELEASTENLSVGADIGGTHLRGLQHVLNYQKETGKSGTAVRVLLLSAFGHTSEVFPVLNAMRTLAPSWRGEYGVAATQSVEILLAAGFGSEPPVWASNNSSSKEQEESTEQKEEASLKESSTRTNDDADHPQPIHRVQSKRMQALTTGESTASKDRIAPQSRSKYKPLYALAASLDDVDDQRRSKNQESSQSDGPLLSTTRETHLALHLLLSVVKNTPMSALREASPQHQEANAQLVKDARQQSMRRTSPPLAIKHQPAPPESKNREGEPERTPSFNRRNVTIDPKANKEKTDDAPGTAMSAPLVAVQSTSMVASSGASSRNNSVAQGAASSENTLLREGTGEKDDSTPTAQRSELLSNSIVSPTNKISMTPAERLRGQTPWPALALVLECGLDEKQHDTESEGERINVEDKYHNLTKLRGIMLYQQRANRNGGGGVRKSKE